MRKNKNSQISIICARLVFILVWLYFLLNHYIHIRYYVIKLYVLIIRGTSFIVVNICNTLPMLNQNIHRTVYNAIIFPKVFLGVYTHVYLNSYRNIVTQYINIIHIKNDWWIDRVGIL